MSISAITGGSAAATPQTTIQGSKEEFLRLFMAQLQHQDPLDPATGADMVAQLAQMSQVEQARETNNQLASLAAAQASSASAGMASLVGRTCDAAASDIQLDGKGAVPPLVVESTAPMKGAAVVITDANGKEVRRMPVADGARSATLEWDGKDAGGGTLPPGNYTISVEPGTSTSPITSTWRARIDALELTADGPRLRMGGVLIAPAAIRTIGPLSASPGLLP